jgi:hypothetical protein
MISGVTGFFTFIGCSLNGGAQERCKGWLNSWSPWTARWASLRSTSSTEYQTSATAIVRGLKADQFLGPPPVALDEQTVSQEDTYRSVTSDQKIPERPLPCLVNGWFDVGFDRGRKKRLEPRGAAHRPRCGPLVCNARL